MTTATLDTDSVASLSPSRLSAWLPRLFAHASGGVLRQPARWPFSSGLSRDRHSGALPASPAAAPQPVGPAHDAPTHEPIERDTPAPQARAAAPAMRGPISSHAAHSQSLGSAAHVARSGLTKRQMVTDVLLVAMWGALIPGLMWLGAAAGF